MKTKQKTEGKEMIGNWVYNDGGRKEAGFKGKTGDCVVRSIAIVSERHYKEVYDFVNGFAKKFEKNKRKIKGSNARTGMKQQTTRALMEHLGFEWVSLMGIGTGCKVHLKKEELPKGNIICRLSGHLVAVKNGIIHDTFDPSRDGTRCVYGYWRQKQ